MTVHDAPRSFSRRDLDERGALLDSYAGPRHLFVQWVPQGFGYRSMNVGFAMWLAARGWRRHDRLHLMVHEPFLPWSSNPVHLAVSLVHRIMLLIASRGATRVWLSTSAGRAGFVDTCHHGCPWNGCLSPRRTADAESALRVTSASHSEHVGSERIARERIGAGQTVGHFGTHTSLVTALLAPAIDVVLRQTQARVLLIGRDSDAFRTSFIATRPHAAERVQATGVLRPDAVAPQLLRCDVMIQPYPDGVTTRRTSTLALLSLGMPVVTNAGHLSESIWRDAKAVALTSTPDGTLIGESAVALLGDPRERAALAARALAVYDAQFAPRHAVAMLNAAAWPQHHAA